MLDQSDNLQDCFWLCCYLRSTTSYLTGSVFATALNVFDVSDITQYLDHGKSSSISQLVKG